MLVGAGLGKVSCAHPAGNVALTVGTLMRPTTISWPSRTMVWNLTNVASSGTERLVARPVARETHGYAGCGCAFPLGGGGG